MSSKAVKKIASGQNTASDKSFTSETIEQFEHGDPKVSGQLFLGDNWQVGNHLLKEFRGKVKLIYLDPPFDIGQDLVVELSSAASKQRMVAYSDRWEGGAYEKMMRQRLELAHQLLSEDGSLYLHCDYRTTARLRFMLEEIFGVDNYINEIIWLYKTGGVPRNLGFSRKHDTIHFVVKNRAKTLWNPQLEKSYLSHRYGFSNIEIFEDEKGPYTMTALRDVWDIAALRGNQPERVNYPTQKPEALLERIILASSNPGDLVLDLFSGSGTTAVAAQKAGRNWIAVDQHLFAVHTARKRLVNLSACKFTLSAEAATERVRATVKVLFGKNEKSTNGKFTTVQIKEFSSSSEPDNTYDMWAVGTTDSTGFASIGEMVAQHKKLLGPDSELAFDNAKTNRLVIYSERGNRFEFELPKESGEHTLHSL